MEEHEHLRIDALHRRIAQLEDHVRRLSEHIGVPGPEGTTPSETETAAVRRLLAEGREHEALRLQRDFSGQTDDEARETLESLRAGL